LRLSINNMAVENVPSFVYLGSTLTWDNDCSVEVKNRIQKATGVYSDLKVIWNDTNIRIEQKIQLLDACVFSILLYAADTWTLKKADEKRLAAFEMRCYRRLLRIRWQDFHTNESIRRQLSRQHTIVDSQASQARAVWSHMPHARQQNVKESVV